MSTPRLVLPLACVAAFLVIMDATIVAVALPAMGASLGIGPATLPWVVNAYTLAFAGFLLLGGRVTDLVGHRRALVVGLVVFGLASLAGGLATSAWMLLAARAAKGIGGALLMPATLAVVTTTYSGPARTRALAVWSMVGAVGATAGTLLGGVLTEWAGWRWVLLVGAPPALLTAALVPRAVGPREHGGPRESLDVVGAVLATTGLTALVLGISRAQWAPLTAAAVLLGVFAVHQRRWARTPLVPPDTFRPPGVRTGNLVMFVVGSTPITVAATDRVPADRQGLAAGVLNTTRQLSGAIGLAVLSAVALAAGYGAAMAWACALCALAAGCCVLLPRQRSQAV